MSITRDIAILSGISALAFLLGRLTVKPQNNSLTKPSAPSAEQPLPPASSPIPPANNTLRTAIAQRPRLIDPAARLNRFQKAAILGDVERQAAILCDLILDADQSELEEMTKLLKQYQQRGNAWDQEVWNELWKQWGRLAPMRCLELAKQGQGMVHGGDYEQLMAGWLEVDPQGAEEFVSSLPEGHIESGVAAYFVTKGHYNTPEEMGQAILEGTSNDQIRTASIHRYLDYCVSLTDQPMESLYERTPEELQPYLINQFVDRLSYTQAEKAAAWLIEHADEEGLVGRTVLNLHNKLPSGSATRAKLVEIYHDQRLSLD
ncbi:MAG: hypothetical protein Q7Q71_05065 [Verrucomicrobiota bacterium JB023]|nr:hypothetical protein [Verrucomicrobiota bacterium JB023]